MHNNEFLIVHKSILPSQFEDIIKIREMIKNKNMSVIEACKMMNISRSTFYKYKDYIFLPNKEYGNRASIALKTIDEKGILSNVLSLIYEHGANVISINQDAPIDGFAFITMTIDNGDAKNSIDKLIDSFKNLKGILKIDIIGVE